jgi:hypothetical protein
MSKNVTSGVLCTPIIRKLAPPLSSRYDRDYYSQETTNLHICYENHC